MNRWICLILLGIATLADTQSFAEPPRDDYSIVLKLPARAEKNEPPVVTCMAVSPDATWLAAAGDDHVIHVFDVESLTVIASLVGHEDWVQSLDFSPDKQWLVSCGNDGQVRLWNPQQQWQTTLLAKQPYALSAIHFSADSQQIIAVGFSNTIQAWSTASRQTLWSYRDPCQDLKALAIHPTEPMIAWGGRDGFVTLFHSDEARVIYRQKLHAARVRGLEFNAEGSVLSSVGEDRRLARYDLLSQDLVLDKQYPSSKWLTVKTIDSVTLGLGGSDNGIHFYSTADGLDMGKLVGHRGSVRAICVAGDRLITSGFDTDIRVWDLQNLWQVLDTSPSDASLSISK